MPDATPLTSTPYALLTDAANIETAGKPGFEHLEKFAIPRYSSVSARNAAFTGITPGTGQLTYISNNGYQGYQVWDGSQWVEFGAFTRTRTYLATNYGGANFVTNSTIFVNVTGYSVELPIGLYRVELDLHYRTAGNSTQIRTNWTFPGAQSEMTFGVIARGQEASGGGRTVRPFTTRPLVAVRAVMSPRPPAGTAPQSLTLCSPLAEASSI